MPDGQAQPVHRDRAAEADGGGCGEAQRLRRDLGVAGDDLQRVEPHRFGSCVQQRGGGDVGLGAAGDDVRRGLDRECGLRPLRLDPCIAGDARGIEPVDGDAGIDGGVAERVGHACLDRRAADFAAGDAGVAGVGVDDDCGGVELGIGGNGAGDGLADEGLQIREPGHFQRDLAERQGGAGGEGELALGMQRAPVGPVDGRAYGAVGGACGVECEGQRGVGQGALGADATGRRGRQAREVGFDGDRRLLDLGCADVAGDGGLRGKVVERPVHMRLKLGMAGDGGGEQGKVRERGRGREVHPGRGVGAARVEADGGTVQRELLQRDVLPGHGGGERDGGVPADQCGGGRRAIGEADGAFGRDRARSRGVAGAQVQLRATGDFLPGRGGKGCEVRQRQRGGGSDVTGGLGGACEADQRMIERETDRACGVIELRGRLQV